MSKVRSVLKWMSVPALALILASAAGAQAPRTWVSGTGDDYNPCSRTLPCKTFAGALSKTLAGGEISVIDSGAYGTVNITSSITIDGTGSLASILSAGFNAGITVNAGPLDRVVIRNVAIQGGGTGVNGIRFLSGRELVLENVAIQNLTTRGVDVALAAPNGTLSMKNVSITDVSTGVRLTTTTGTVMGLLEEVRMNTLGIGLEVAAGGNAVARNCEISRNSIGVQVTSASGNASIESSVVSFNGTGVTTSAAGGNINLADNGFYGNSNAVTIPGGIVSSAGDNRIVGATTPPNGVVNLY